MQHFAKLVIRAGSAKTRRDGDRRSFALASPRLVDIFCRARRAAGRADARRNGAVRKRPAAAVRWQA